MKAMAREVAQRLPDCDRKVVTGNSITNKLCTWFNKPWLDFVGRTMEQELGYGWSENVHPGDFDRCIQVYNVAFDARQPFTMDYRLKRHDGEYRWLLDNGMPTYGATSDFSGYIGSCVDITNLKRAEEALRQNEAQSRHLLDFHQAVMANMGGSGPICKTSAAEISDFD
jgi:PAS domain S-box-containing protein